MYVLFLFIFSGDPDTGSAATLVESQVFDTESACNHAAASVREFVDNYASIAERAVSNDVQSEFENEGEAVGHWASLFAHGQQARALCVPKS